VRLLSGRLARASLSLLLLFAAFLLLATTWYCFLLLNF
jgi:hypothetical protein